LRIRFFNEQFERIMPDLYKYFDNIDITTDIYLMEWMLTLYSKHLHIDISSRIWDSFLLDGEAFAIRVGLAILKYFENVFLRVRKEYAYFKALCRKHILISFKLSKI